MSVIVNDDGSVDVVGASGGDPVHFDPATAEAVLGPLGASDQVTNPAEQQLVDDLELAGIVGAPGPEFAELPQEALPADPTAPVPGADPSLDALMAGAAGVEPVGPVDPGGFGDYLQAGVEPSALVAAPAAPGAAPGAGPPIETGVPPAGLTGQPGAPGAQPSSAEQLDALTLSGAQQATAAEVARHEALAEHQARLEEINQRQAANESRLAEIQADQLRKNADRLAEASAQMAEVQAELEAAVAQEPDQTRWWSSRSTFAKVAVFLGAALQGGLRPGEPNEFLAAIDAEIDRDIKLQQDTLRQQVEALGQKKQVVGETLDLDIEMIKATASAKMVKFQAITNTLDRQARHSGSSLEIETMRAETLRRMGEIRQNAAKEIQARHIERDKLALQRDQVRTQIRAQRAAAKLGQDRLAFDREKEAARAEQAEAAARAAQAATASNAERGGERGELTISGLVDKDGNPTERNILGRPAEAQNLREAMAAANEVTGLIDAMLKAGPDSYRINPFDENSAVAESYRKQLAGKLRIAIVGPGPMSDADQARLDAAMPQLDAFLATTATPAARRQMLAGIKDTMQGHVESMLVVGGVDDAKYVPAPVGEERAKARLRSFDKDIQTEIGIEAPGLTISEEDLQTAVADRAREQGLDPNDHTQPGYWEKMKAINEEVRGEATSLVVNRNLSKLSQKDEREKRESAEAEKRDAKDKLDAFKKRVGVDPDLDYADYAEALGRAKSLGIDVSGYPGHEQVEVLRAGDN